MIDTCKNIMIVSMFVVVMLNLGLTVYTLNVVKNASTQLSSGTSGLSDVNTHLQQLSSMATQVQQLMDSLGPKSRLAFNLFPISIPNLLNEVLRVDFQSMAHNISKLALSVESAMRFHNQGEGMLSAAQYSSLVASVAKQVNYLKPVNNPKYAPPEDTENNDLVLLVVSGLMNIIDFEVDDPQPWAELASTCMDFVDNFLSVNWAGTYTGEYGQRLSWSIMQQVQSPFQSVFDYCFALANLTTSDQFNLGDMLAHLNDQVSDPNSNKGRGL